MRVVARCTRHTFSKSFPCSRSFTIHRDLHDKVYLNMMPRNSEDCRRRRQYHDNPFDEGCFCTMESIHRSGHFEASQFPR